MFAQLKLQCIIYLNFLTQTWSCKYQLLNINLLIESILLLIHDGFLCHPSQFMGKLKTYTDLRQQSSAFSNFSETSTPTPRAYQPAHPYSSISNFVFPFLDSTESVLSKSKISRRSLVSVGEKSGRKPRKTSFVMISLNLVHENYCLLTIEDTYYKT